MRLKLPSFTPPNPPPQVAPAWHHAAAGGKEGQGKQQSAHLTIQSPPPPPLPPPTPPPTQPNHPTHRQPEATMSSTPARPADPPIAAPSPASSSYVRLKDEDGSDGQGRRHSSLEDEEREQEAAPDTTGFRSGFLLWHPPTLVLLVLLGTLMNAEYSVSPSKDPPIHPPSPSPAAHPSPGGAPLAYPHSTTQPPTHLRLHRSSCPPSTPTSKAWAATRPTWGTSLRPSPSPGCSSFGP